MAIFMPDPDDDMFLPAQRELDVAVLIGKKFINRRAPTPTYLVPKDIYFDAKGTRWAAGEMTQYGIVRDVEKELFDPNGWQEMQ